jgi:gamma-tubulin complex component 2
MPAVAFGTPSHTPLYQALDTPYGTPGPASRGGVASSSSAAAAAAAMTPGGSRLLGPRDQDLPGWDLFLPTIKLDWPATLVVSEG